MCLLVDNNKVDLLADFHSETDLREGRVPVGGQLSLLIIKPSLSTMRVERFSIGPEVGIIMESSLFTN